jgi:hypothetical protein
MAIMKKYLRIVSMLALCGIAVPAGAARADGASAAAGQSAPYNPFMMDPPIPGQVPDWKPVPPSKPMLQPPSMENNKAYQASKGYSECVEKVMPIKNRSPVDLESTSLAFTSQMQAAINACLASKGVAPSPVTAEDMPENKGDVAEEASYDPSAYANERASRSEKMRDMIKETGLDKFLPPEGSKGAAPAPAPVATAVKAPAAPAAPPTVAPSGADTGKPQTAQTPPYVPALADKPIRGQGVFVPPDDSGPSPVCLP